MRCVYYMSIAPGAMGASAHRGAFDHGRRRRSGDEDRAKRDDRSESLAGRTSTGKTEARPIGEVVRSTTSRGGEGGIRTYARVDARGGFRRSRRASFGIENRDEARRRHDRVDRALALGRVDGSGRTVARRVAIARSRRGATHGGEGSDRQRQREACDGAPRDARGRAEGRRRPDPRGAEPLNAGLAQTYA